MFHRAIRGSREQSARIRIGILALCLLLLGACADRPHPRGVQVARQCGVHGVITLVCVTW